MSYLAAEKPLSSLSDAYCCLSVFSADNNVGIVALEPHVALCSASNFHVIKLEYLYSKHNASSLQGIPPGV